MDAGAPSIEPSRVDAADVARIWVRHLTSLLLPVNALAFLFTGPHAWYVAPLFMLPVVGALVLDDGPRMETRQPDEDLPAWPFDALVYTLAGLQLLAVFGIARMFAVQSVFSVDMVVMITVVGGSSGFAIITAHELIHRRKPWERSLGRLLLCTVLQEHFFTEHLRGHHVRVGTAEDPATARFGEDYQSFYRRSSRARGSSRRSDSATSGCRISIPGCSATASFTVCWWDGAWRCGSAPPPGSRPSSRSCSRPSSPPGCSRR